MKTLWIYLLLAFTCVNAMAAPDVVIYRYQAKNSQDYVNLPESKITDQNMDDAWIRDDGKFQNGRIAFLVHGLPMFNEGKNRKGLIALADNLSHPRKLGENRIPAYDYIYVAEYPSNYHLLATANAIAEIISNRIAALPKGTKIDVFAHCMGAMVMRHALEGPELLLHRKPIASLVNHFVLMGAPNTGFTRQNLILFYGIFSYKPEICDLDQEDIANLLNFANAQKPKNDCIYYSVVGTRSYRPNQYFSTAVGPLAGLMKSIRDDQVAVHDGLVDANGSSMNLSAYCKAFTFSEVELNHEYVKGHEDVYKVIDAWMVMDKWFGENAEPVKNKQITKFTGGLPILLGKTPAEVEKLLNYKKGDVKIPIGNKLTIAANPPGMSLCYQDLLFVKDKNIFQDDLPRVYRFEWSNVTNVSVSQVVPKEIIAAKPDGIFNIANFYMREKNRLIIMWYINGCTFFLEVRNAKDLVEFYQKKRGANGERQLYQLTDAGKNWPNGSSVVYFCGINKTIDLNNYKVKYSDYEINIFSHTIRYLEITK